MTRAGPLEAQLAAGWLGLRQRCLLGRAPTRRHRSAHQVDIGTAPDALRRSIEKRRHRVVHMGVASAGRFLDGQQRTLAHQLRIERGGKQRRQILRQIHFETTGVVALWRL